MSDKTVQKGLFYETLNGSNAQILRDRSEDIIMDTHQDYNTAFNILERDLRNAKADRKPHMDLSPVSKDVLTFTTNFKSQSWVQKDIELSMKIMNFEMKLEVLRKRIEELYS